MKEEKEIGGIVRLKEHQAHREAQLAYETAYHRGGTNDATPIGRGALSVSKKPGSPDQKKQ